MSYDENEFKKNCLYMNERKRLSRDNKYYVQKPSGQLVKLSAVDIEEAVREAEKLFDDYDEKVYKVGTLFKSSDGGTKK